MTKREITTGALITLLLGLAAPLWAQVQLPDPVYQISMSASYEPEDHHIDGSKRIRWRNTSSVPIDELQFHLYLNAFANDRSTFMVGSGGQLRGVTRCHQILDGDTPGIIPVQVKYRAELGQERPAYHQFEIAENVTGLVAKIFTRLVASADNRHAAIHHQQLVVHAVVYAGKVIEVFQFADHCVTGALRCRVVNAITDAGMA